MEFEYPSFGTIVIDGKGYDHDVVVADGEVRRREKGPSRAMKAQYGHTPLTAGEAIPWSRPKLVVGSGYSGRLPVLAEIEERGARHGVEVVVMPTADAVTLLNRADQTGINAILHVTC